MLTNLPTWHSGVQRMEEPLKTKSAKDSLIRPWDKQLQKPFPSQSRGSLWRSQRVTEISALLENPKLLFKEGEGTKAKWEEVILQLAGAVPPELPTSHFTWVRLLTNHCARRGGSESNPERGSPLGFSCTRGTAVQSSRTSLRARLDAGHDFP